MNNWIFILLMALSASAFAEPLFVPGQYVVKLKGSDFAPTLAPGSRILKTVSTSLKLFLVSRPPIETPDSAVRSLMSNPIVEYAEPNYLYRLQNTPNDLDFSALWGLSNLGQMTHGDGGDIEGVQGVDIAALDAWKIEQGSKDVIVAVIDTGVDYLQSDLVNNIYTNKLEAAGQPGVDDDANGFIDDVHGYDFVDRDADPRDEVGHGTHVAAILGAEGNNAMGGVGVNWRVSILPVRFIDSEGAGDEVTAIEAIEYATKMKARVMNNSWGGMAKSLALREAIDQARLSGALFFASAGNFKKNNDEKPNYPASYDLDNVIAVAAIDPKGELAKFSNYGPKTVSIAAPGVNILSLTPGGEISMSGTSMAAPYVSGVAALLFAHRPTLNYSQVKSCLLNSVSPLTSLKDKVSSGGMVHAARALQACE